MVENLVIQKSSISLSTIYVFQNDSNVRVYNDKKHYYDVASQVNHSAKGNTVTMGKIEVTGITVWWFH